MSKQTLLIIDEDAYHAGIFANRFEQAGWKVRVAESIADAERQLEKGAPDAIIFDPTGIDEGFAYIRKFRQDGAYLQSVITVLTKPGDRASILEAEDAGLDGYFFKGHFFPSEAIKKLQRLVDERRALNNV
jgi:DNA-binding response OmpR family regulator